MKSLLTLFTALAVFCVQPNVNNIGSISDAPVVSASSAGHSSDSNDTGSLPPSGQMPEIEVTAFDGDLLHVTPFHFVEPAVSGTVVVVVLPDPEEHTTFPLLRPPRA